ncbi:MAG: hypothetical protein OFPII_12410 [Osedax symbiont Rs1]|nr:MAG: hypothetical protein OFPII_12410 [Osedax symbiont Rs1]
MAIFDMFSSDQILIIVIAASLIVIIIVGAIKLGAFSKTNNPSWGHAPFPRTEKIQIFNWFNGWANWKSRLYTGKKLTTRIAYIGHHLTEINNNQATIRSNGWFYTRKTLLSIWIGIAFVTTSLIIMDDYKWFYIRDGGMCPIIQVVKDKKEVVGYVDYNGSFYDYIGQEFCVIKNVFGNSRLHDTVERKVKYFLSSNYYIRFTWLASFLIICWLVFTKSPPPLVFDRKRRLVYTQYKGKIYLSDWDKLFYSIRTTYQAHSIGFELYHLDKKGRWKPKWFSVAGHHYYGELNDHLLSLNAVNSNRSHAMRAWLILFMEKGPLAVHPVLPFKGILDTLTPRKGSLSLGFEEQLAALLKSIDYQAPGAAEKVSQADPEIQQLLRQNNDVDLYDILTEKNLAKYIADRDTKAAKQS